MLTIREPYNQFSDNDREGLMKLCNMINKPKATFIEIGCWLGNSTSIIAQRAKELDGKVICIDTFRGTDGIDFLEEYSKNNDVYNEFVSNMDNLGLRSFINIFFMKSDDAHSFIKDNSVDFLFIDGDHRYNAINNDILNYRSKIIKDGIICGHDYEPGFNLDIDSISKDSLNSDMFNGFHCGVIKAVKENIENFKLTGDRIWWAYV